MLDGDDKQVNAYLPAYECRERQEVIVLTRNKSEPNQIYYPISSGFVLLYIWMNLFMLVGKTPEDKFPVILPTDRLLRSALDKLVANKLDHYYVCFMYNGCRVHLIKRYTVL